MKPSEPTVADFDKLLGYLPLLYADGLKPIHRWGGGSKTDGGVFAMPCPVYEEIVVQFFEAVAGECWTDYEYISKRIGKVIRDPQRVARATLEEIKTMLTWCVRGERFCDGHWGNVIEEGYVRNVLLRLRELRPQ